MLEEIFDRDKGDQLSHFFGREWLETNGIRGYACGTVADMPTRKYHGLLQVDVPEAGGRFLLLSALQGVVDAGGREYDVSSFQYPGVVHPDGVENLSSFSYGLYPQWRWRCGSSVIERELMLVRGENTVLVRYRLVSGAPVRLRLCPLLAYRPHHELTKCNADLDRRVHSPAEGVAVVKPYPALPELTMSLSGGKPEFEPGAFWNYNVEYDVERQRGFSYREDLFCPGQFSCELRKDKPVVFRAGTDGVESTTAGKAWQAELRRREADAKPYFEQFADDDALALLHARGGETLVTNSRGESSVIAGYPWFDEWGRDTMIALAGLTVYRGRNAEALAVLKAYAGYARVGLIPNILGAGPDAGDAFNSVDASLWFFRAVQQYEQKSGDQDGVIAELLPTMEHLVRYFLENRAEHVRIRQDGLFEVAPAGASFTWMDACVNGVAMTPRDGLAVDLNALWYNALCYVTDLQARGGATPDADLLAAAQRAQSAFTATFWVKDGDYLADVVRNGVQDKAVRPNQLVAAAVAFSPLTRTRMHGVVERVRRELVTPLGLRTLSPKDPKYAGRYEGGPEYRDSIYHQGAVWPWLIGLYADACLQAAGDSAEVRGYLRELFRPLYTSHLYEGGLFAVSEILDGDAPRKPRGCFSQAWSVAELIRVLALTR